MKEGDIESPKVNALFSRTLLRGIPRKRIDLLGQKFEYPDVDEINQPDPYLHLQLSVGIEMLNTAKRFEDQGLKQAAEESLHRARRHFSQAEGIATGKPAGGDQAEDSEQKPGDNLDIKV